MAADRPAALAAVMIAATLFACGQLGCEPHDAGELPASTAPADDPLADLPTQEEADRAAEEAIAPEDADEAFRTLEAEIEADAP